MPYAEIQPTAALWPWVECFWTSRDDADAGERRVLPDGCADLVFDLTGGEWSAVGTMTRPRVVPVRAGGEFLGVRFRPGRAAAFLRLPLAEITDARVPLRDVIPSVARGLDGWARRRPGPSASARLRMTLERVLLERLDPDRDPRVDAAIDRIVRGDGRIEQIADDIGISRQHLARRFLHHVGVSPKTFARVMRFRRVLSSLHQDADWADIAVAHGYYDQSHLIADFRELAGETPNAFHFSNR